MRKLFIALLFVSSPLVAYATVREVGPGQTYATISACHTAATAGDTCNVHADTYTETVTLTKQLTIQNNSGDSPTLVGKILANAVSNVTITCNNGGGQMEITGYGTVSAGSYGVYQSGGTGLTVTGCSIHDGYGAGIYSRNSTRLTITNNHVYNALPASAGTTATGIQVQSGHSTDGTYANGVAIYGNTLHDNYVDAVNIHGQYFSVHDNYIYNQINTDWAAKHPDGIQILGSTVDGYTTGQHMLIYNNVIRDATQLIFVEGTLVDEAADCDDIWVFNNVLYVTDGVVNGVDMRVVGTTALSVRRSNRVYIYNNTFGNSNGYAIYTLDGATGGIHIKNNVFHKTFGNGILVSDVVQIASGELDYNIYDVETYPVVWGASYYTTVAAFNAAHPTEEGNGIDAGPLIGAFPNVTLSSGSPAIGAGVDLSGVCSLCVTDIAGRSRSARWDMGAYQYYPSRRVKLFRR